MPQQEAFTIISAVFAKSLLSENLGKKKIGVKKKLDFREGNLSPCSSSS